jgi:hypothetical protein
MVVAAIAAECRARRSEHDSLAGSLASRSAPVREAATGSQANRLTGGCWHDGRSVRHLQTKKGAPCRRALTCSWYLTSTIEQIYLPVGVDELEPEPELLGEPLPPVAASFFLSQPTLNRPMLQIMSNAQIFFITTPFLNVVDETRFAGPSCTLSTT